MTHPVTSVSCPVRARRSLVGSAVPRTERGRLWSAARAPGPWTA